MSRTGISVLAMLVLGGCEHHDEHLFFSDVPYPSSPSVAQSGVSLEFIREYGDRDQGLVFGHIVSMAANPAGVLAVYDRDDCRIWLVDTQGAQWKAVGRCGEGPGEFKSITAMTFSGDTLIVFDEGRQALVRLDSRGEELERMTPALAKWGALSISDLAVDGEGKVAAGLDLAPSEPTADYLQVAVFDPFGEGSAVRGLAAPPLARKTPRPIVRYSSLCSGVSPSGERVIVAANTWGPQAVVLRQRDLKALSSLRVPVAWALPNEHSLRPGYWGPMYPIPKTACGRELAVIGYRDQQYLEASRSWEVRAAAMIVLDLDGNLVAAVVEDGPLSSRSVMFMTPGAATGERFFFFTNSFFDYPVVHEYRIVRTAG